MTWISLVCLLALSSSALARSMYGSGYGSAPVSFSPLPQTNSYGGQKSFVLPKSSYGTPAPRIETLPLPKALDNYGAQPAPRIETLPLPKALDNYGAQPAPQPEILVTKSVDSYGAQPAPQPEIFVPKTISGYGTAPVVERVPEIVAPKTFDNYGAAPAAPRVAPAYGAAPAVPRVISGYGSAQPLPRVISNYGAAPRTIPTYGSYAETSPRILSEADSICRGKAPETIIPLDGGRRYIVCLGDDKGEEMVCQKGLYYSLETRQCDYKAGSFPDLCASQPCLNGGQCRSLGFTYECACTAGYDGKFCELDARVCQTQQPCGQSPDTRCQSFRFGAALSHACIFQGGFAYGFSAGQTSPNPCAGFEGTQPLAFTNKGFIMCDGDRMSIESCPGGTIWDDVNKACSWPDMEGVPAPAPVFEQRSNGYSNGYGAELPKPVFETQKFLMPNRNLIQPKSGY